MSAASDELHAPWNVKGMPVDIRRRAVQAAAADGQTIAHFLAEAVTLLIDKRAGNIVMPPRVEPPTPLTPDQLTERMKAVAALQQGVAADRQASGRATGRVTLRRCMASLEQRLIEAEGEPVRTPRRIEDKRLVSLESTAMQETAV